MFWLLTLAILSKIIERIFFCWPNNDSVRVLKLRRAISVEQCWWKGMNFNWTSSHELRVFKLQGYAPIHDPDSKFAILLALGTASNVVTSKHFWFQLWSRNIRGASHKFPSSNNVTVLGLPLLQVCTVSCKVIPFGVYTARSTFPTAGSISGNPGSSCCPALPPLQL
jgi:hypothetical protein